MAVANGLPPTQIPALFHDPKHRLQTDTKEAERLVWIVRLVVLVNMEQKGLSSGALPAEADVGGVYRWRQ